MTIKLPTKRFLFLNIIISATRYTGQINIVVGAWDQLPDRPGYMLYHGASFSVIHNANTADLDMCAGIWTLENGRYFYRYDNATLKGN